MDTVFFSLSKLIGFIITPENLILILLGYSLLLAILKQQKSAKKWFIISSSITLFIAILPIGNWLLYPLETHFNPKPVLPEKVDGIILLGGSFSVYSSQTWNRVQTNEFSDRIFSFLALIKKYPDAKAIFTGGNASLIQNKQTEAKLAQALFSSLGIPKGRIIYEDKARNTYENVLYSKQRIQPKPHETWVVVSSAFHLPRTVGIFCQQRWPVIPYPADFHSNSNTIMPHLNLVGHLQQLNYALHEWVGLTAYYLTDKTTQWLPTQCR